MNGLVQEMLDQRSGLWSRGGKRTFDLVASALALVLLCPVLALIAIAIKLDSTGPVVFRQQRTGRSGRPFEILKFRTMVHEAQRQGAALTVARDPRVTRVGWFLRRFELDELPTLANVLKGDMSIVGPRPEVPRFISSYDGVGREALMVRPGMTDLGTLEFRDEAQRMPRDAPVETLYVAEILPRKIALGCEYVTRQSFLLDMQIILRTWVQILRQSK